MHHCSFLHAFIIYYSATTRFFLFPVCKDLLCLEVLLQSTSDFSNSVCQSLRSCQTMISVIKYVDVPSVLLIIFESPKPAVKHKRNKKMDEIKENKNRKIKSNPHQQVKHSVLTWSINSIFVMNWGAYQYCLRVIGTLTLKGRCCLLFRRKKL